MYKKIIRFILYANHHANQWKVRKTMPTNVPTTFNKWQNSAEKSQAHNLKVVGSNPTPATNLLIKINDLYVPQELWFLGLFVVILSVYTTIIPTGRQVFPI